MLLIQEITVVWSKDSRGAYGTNQRNRLKCAEELPKKFFDYIPFGVAVHRVTIFQKKDGFYINQNCKVIYEYKNNELKIRPFLITKNDDESYLVDYKYAMHNGRMPRLYSYDTQEKYSFLEEKAFLINEGDYGRAIVNGRFVDYDTGEWWYEQTILNIMVAKEGRISRDCFTKKLPNYNYCQVAGLY